MWHIISWSWTLFRKNKQSSAVLLAPVVVPSLCSIPVSCPAFYLVFLSLHAVQINMFFKRLVTFDFPRFYFLKCWSCHTDSFIMSSQIPFHLTDCHSVFFIYASQPYSAMGNMVLLTTIGFVCLHCFVQASVILFSYAVALLMSLSLM